KPPSGTSRRTPIFHTVNLRNTGLTGIRFRHSVKKLKSCSATRPTRIDDVAQLGSTAGHSFWRIQPLQAMPTLSARSQTLLPNQTDPMLPVRVIGSYSAPEAASIARLLSCRPPDGVQLPA